MRMPGHFWMCSSLKKSRRTAFYPTPGNLRRHELTLLQYNYHTTLDDVCHSMENDAWNVQPESKGFIIVELQSGLCIRCDLHGLHIHHCLYPLGGATYLRCQAHGLTDVPIKDLTFFVKGMNSTGVTNVGNDVCMFYFCTCRKEACSQQNRHSAG